MRWLVLLLPVVGLFELALHAYFRQRAPAADEWAAAPGVVDRLRRAGEPIVVAPEWAEPLARAALGDERMPLTEVARADESGYPALIELSVLGARASGLEGFRETARVSRGPFVARRLEPLVLEKPLWRALEHVAPESLAVEWLAAAPSNAPSPCRFDASAPTSARGLGGHMALPKTRFRCGPDETLFVGLTLIDDQDYRPRRCLHAKPPSYGALRLRFSGVNVGAKLVGYTGSSFLLARDADSEVSLRFEIDGQPAGSVLSRDSGGFQRFELSSAAFRGSSRSLSVEVRSAARRDLDFCFVLETR